MTPTKKLTREKGRPRRPPRVPSVYEVDAVIAANIKSGMWQRLRQVTIHYARSLGKPGLQVLAESLARMFASFEEQYPGEADEMRASAQQWSNWETLPPLTETIEDLRRRAESVSGRIH